MSVFERAVDSLSEKLPSVAASCNASRCVRLDPGVPSSSTCVYALEAPLRIVTRESKRGRDKKVCTRGNNAAHCRTTSVYYALHGRARSRVISRIRFSCRCGFVDRDEMRYLSNKLGNICDTLHAQVSPRPRCRERR